MTYEELLAVGRAAAGHELETVTGRKFTVGINGDELFFTPASSGWGQTDGRKAHRRFVDRFNDTGSLQPRDYADVTRNASYLVGLLRWRDKERRG